MSPCVLRKAFLCSVGFLSKSQLRSTIPSPINSTKTNKQTNKQTNKHILPWFEFQTRIEIHEERSEERTQNSKCTELECRQTEFTAGMHKNFKLNPHHTLESAQSICPAQKFERQQSLLPRLGSPATRAVDVDRRRSDEDEDDGGGELVMELCSWIFHIYKTAKPKFLEWSGLQRQEAFSL